jgi:anti-anti-sigma regulatory factor
VGSKRTLSLVVDHPIPESGEPGAGDDQTARLLAVRELSRDGTQLFVRFVGEVSLDTASVLSTALELEPTNAAEQNVTEIVVDLRPVTFLCAAGIEELTHARQRSERAGARMRIIADQWAATRPMRVPGPVQ